MTDPDDSSEGFLGRWSRKKIEGESDAPDAPRTTDVSTPDEPDLPGRRADDAKTNAKTDAKTPAKATPHPEFDLASLPSLDSITAATDVRAFLSPGVPKELARAALRRAWSADPAIRDFVGLAENAWDFTDPTAMAGFGELPPGYDVKKLVAQIFGDGEKPTDPDATADEPTDPQASHIAEEIAAPVSPTEAAPSTPREGSPPPPNVSSGEQQIARNDFVQRDSNIASHNSNSDGEIEEHKNRRQHGGALPQ
jgi:hypothetical protein